MARIREFDDIMMGSRSRRLLADVNKLPPSRMKLTKIPNGAAGTEATLKKMKDIVHNSMRHPQHAAIIRFTTMRVLVDAGVKPKDFLGEYRAIHEFVRDQIRWTRDSKGFETLTWPARTLLQGAEDCDGKSMLEGTMLLMAGFPKVAFKAIKAMPENPNSYSHVYVIAKPTPNSPWIPSDPTVSGAKLGWESPVSFGKPMVMRIDEDE